MNTVKGDVRPQKGPLSVVFADDLPEAFTPPDELVEGVLTVGGGSVLYGDSNSGKTFFTIDLACAVARGVPWMGRRTEPGLVVYVAAESPQSIRSAASCRNKSSKLPAQSDIFVLQIRLTPGISAPTVPTEREGDGPMARLLVIVGRTRMGR